MEHLVRVVDKSDERPAVIFGVLIASVLAGGTFTYLGARDGADYPTILVALGGIVAGGLSLAVTIPITKPLGDVQE